MIYLTGLITIDVTSLIDCENVEKIKHGVERLLNISPKKRSISDTSTRVSGVLVIFDNLEKNKRFLDKNVFFFIEERIKNIESSRFKKLIVYTINENEYIETKIKSTPVNFSEKITKAIANGLNLDPDLVRGHLLPSFIPYPSIDELIEIIRANDIDISKDLSRDKLEALASCSGWQIPLILNYLKITNPSDIGVSCPRIEFLQKKLKNKEISNLISRFIMLEELVAKLVSINLAFLGLLLQPMGISCLEIEGLCNKFRSGVNWLQEAIDDLLLEESFSDTPKCSFKDIIKMVKRRRWGDVITVFEEGWCNKELLAIKAGSYFYHLPILLSELEKPETMSLLYDLFDKYLGLQAPSYKESLTRFRTAIQFVRATLIAVQSEIAKRSHCGVKAILRC